MTTSDSYNFLSTTNQQFVDEVYERAGVLPDVITEQKIRTALRSGNMVLTEWINKGYNLFTSVRTFLPLNVNQGNYVLSAAYSDVIDINTRTYDRPLGGTAFSSAGGNANGVFGGTVPCTQNAPNGYISYDFGEGAQYEITMVGVLTDVNLNYTLEFEWSNDEFTWVSTNTPLVSGSNQFTTDYIGWYDIITPVSARYFRIRETGGATLDIAQLYFTTNINDVVMERISGSEYMSYPNKTLASRPSVFWVDRQAGAPVLVLWPVPNTQFTLLNVRVISMLQDVGAMQNQLQIPARFYDAYCAATAKRVAMKANPLDPIRVDMLKKEADEAYSYAATEDTEKVPLRLIPSYLTGWSYV